VLSERAKLPHGDPVTLDRILLGEVGAHVLDEGARDGGRKIERLASPSSVAKFRGDRRET
jgi:hypothetical protein